MSSKVSRKHVAVIDIGSNSIRLVIYTIYGAAALPHFNEKVMAGLGTNLSDTGRLWPEGVKMALAALRRYRSILDALDVTEMLAIATSAVREADDGAKFTRRAEKMLGVSIEVLTGEEEARLSAFGAASGLHEPRGIVGDLGGSSLELVSIKKGRIGSGETHLLGPLSLAHIDADQPGTLGKHIRKQLKTSAALAKPTPVFYAVGGAWRTLAKIHMDITSYPLQALQGYRMSARDVRQTVKAIMSTDSVLQSRIASTARRRSEMLPYAATVLSVVFDMGRFAELVISSYGVREGVLMQAHGDSARDGLLDAVTESARLDKQQMAFGRQLHEFITPALDIDPDLFGERREHDRIIRAACLYADSGARYHPDHRARLAYDHVLLGPYARASHAERAFIGLALASRYQRRFILPVKDTILMNDDQTSRARHLGALMRLGCVLSGRSAPILAGATLKRTKGKLLLQLAKGREDMVSATVTRRLTQAAASMSLEPDVIFKA